MMDIVDSIPRATKAAVLREIVAAENPRQAMSGVARNHGLTEDEVSRITQRHGWPRPNSMARAAEILEQEAPRSSATAPQAPAPQAGAIGSGVPQVRVDALTPDPDQVRVDVGDVADLARSMSEMGMLQPIVARHHGERLLIVIGERRWTAAKRLGWETVPCIVRSGMKRDQVLATMLVENGQRKDLDPLEIARALRRLQIEMGEGTYHHHVAQKIGRAQSFVSDHLSLLTLSAENQEFIRSGQLSMSAAKKIARADSGTSRAGRGEDGKPAQAKAYLSPSHPLANRVMARCKNRGHTKRGNRKGLGGVGCGECWEEIIRSHEREQFLRKSVEQGRCVVCDGPMEPGHSHGTTDLSPPTP